jgi:hypothetical protein
MGSEGCVFEGIWGEVGMEAKVEGGIEEN